MALTRKFLEALGIEEKVVEQIIEAHADTVTGLKAEIAAAEEQSATVPELKKEISNLKTKLDEKPSDEYQTKYDQLTKEFETYKAQVATEKLNDQKKALIRNAFVEIGVNEKALDACVRATDLESVEIKDGAIVDVDKFNEKAKKDWEGFITEVSTEGAKVATPQNTSNGSMDKEAFASLPMSERMEYINSHPEAQDLL